MQNGKWTRKKYIKESDIVKVVIKVRPYTVCHMKANFLFMEVKKEQRREHYITCRGTYVHSVLYVIQKRNIAEDALEYNEAENKLSLRYEKV